MVPPTLGVSDQHVPAGGKRKREADGIDSTDEYQQGDESGSLVPENYEHSEDDDEDDELEDEDANENVVEEVSEMPGHDESAEPLPKCAVYDGDARAIQKKVTAIPQQVLDELEKHGCLSLKSHIVEAQRLCDPPKITKLRIAILGCAGSGKSSLLNAITGKADLAKSVSPAS
jgi:predicted GTPase